MIPKEQLPQETTWRPPASRRAAFAGRREAFKETRNGRDSALASKSRSDNYQGNINDQPGQEIGVAANSRKELAISTIRVRIEPQSAAAKAQHSRQPIGFELRLASSRATQ